MNTTTSTTSITRRTFLKSTAVAGAALIIGFTVSPKRQARAQATGDGPPPDPNAFLHIGTDNTVTVILAHCELGQGIWTALSMLVAEELDADWRTIRAVDAPAAPAYFHTQFHMQRTGGSSSVLSEFDRYRQVGAMARMLLVQAAAHRYGVAPEACRTDAGFVIVGSQRVSYGALSADAAHLPAPAPASIKLKSPGEWTLIGKPVKRLDTPDKIRGRAQFGMDVWFDGLSIAMVARSPVFGGTVRSYSDHAARAVRGVRDVVQVPSGVAVIADNFWSAKLGRDALTVEWDRGALSSLDSIELRDAYRRLAATPGPVLKSTGNVDDALRRASKVVDVDYAVPYLAHAPMEPLNCAVRITPGKCEIWTGTQTQTADQAAAAAILGLKPEQVELNTVFLGGSFGRRNTLHSDFVREGVEVAKAASRPVKTVWTREDDIRGGYYRPAFVHRARIGLGDDGLPVAWKHTSVGESILAGTPAEVILPNGVDSVALDGIATSAYLNHVAHQQLEAHSPQTGVPVENLRAVGLSENGFIMESIVDELAHAAGRDPLDYRRALLNGLPRHLGVLNLVAEKSGWGQPLPSGHARGLSFVEGFGSYIAQVAEVSIVDGQIRVHTVFCAVDCGLVVNPNTVAAQMEGGIAYGLSATLHDRITFKGGEVQQTNFHDYPVFRLNEMPEVQTFIVPSSQRPGGIGEAGTAPIPAAVANAVFALTGMRIRELPLRVPAMEEQT